MSFKISTDTSQSEGVTVFVLEMGCRHYHCVVENVLLEGKQQAWDTLKASFARLLTEAYSDDKTALL